MFDEETICEQNLRVLPEGSRYVLSKGFPLYLVLFSGWDLLTINPTRLGGVWIPKVIYCIRLVGGFNPFEKY